MNRTGKAAIAATDLRGLVTSWNSGAQQLLGWSEDEVCGRHVELMFTEQDRAANAPEQEMRIALEQGRYVPSLALAFRIARVFEQTLEEVFTYEDR